MSARGGSASGGVSHKFKPRGFMDFWVYVLKSLKSDKHYVGSTHNVPERLKQNNRGICRYTKGHMPWKIVLTEPFTTRTEAIKQERFYKSGVGRKVLKEKLLPNQ
jgi:putative endonuclease